MKHFHQFYDHLYTDMFVPSLAAEAAKDCSATLPAGSFQEPADAAGSLRSAPLTFYYKSQASNHCGRPREGAAAYRRRIRLPSFHGKFPIFFMSLASLGWHSQEKTCLPDSNPRPKTARSFAITREGPCNTQKHFRQHINLCCPCTTSCIRQFTARCNTIVPASASNHTTCCPSDPTNNWPPYSTSHHPTPSTQPTPTYSWK